MNRIAQLRKFFTISLLTVALFLGTAFSHVAQSALAADSRSTNDVSNVKGDSSAVNRSYHNLQAATQDYRRTFRTGEEGGTPPGKKSPQSGRNTRTKQAAKNVGKNTRGAFERAADAVKDTFD
ncbi:hypothetical protein H6F76_06245 [Leptolyngbya sp. FACHB-321]|uniref:hypothetical protein n=1 Tax=Leptolyngbya sp. FACHB-321 TaxID=2692807 RepID=UPI00168A0F4A|nr:hypothetical protein [Leptolyngbya sp. FACHB-321]MBD2034632.1 hypothetical protein [Leptolyngbya sp. FACHB-321]